MIPSNHLILCHPLLLLPPVFPRTRVFSSESALPIRWPKYWCFSFSNSPSSEYSGLISFRIDWFDLLVVQGILRSFFQHHSSKVSILHHSAFFIIQLSYPYMSTGKTITLTRRIFVVTVQSLSRVQLFVTPWTAALQASLSFTISQSLLKLMSIESVMPSNLLILSPPSPPVLSLSQHRGLFQ